MNYVIDVVWNTDHENRWIADSTGENWDTLPVCVYGPFETMKETEQYMMDMMDDTDMNDVYARLMMSADNQWLNDPKMTLWSFMYETERVAPISLYTAGVEAGHK